VGLALPVLAVVWAAREQTPVVLAGVPADPRPVAALAALAGTVAAFVAAASETAAQDVGARPGSSRWFVRWPINLGKAALPVAGWGATAVVVLVVAVDGDVRVLDPPSRAGCRVLVREGYSAGRVLLLPPGTVRPVEVDGYGWDDGPGPVALGAATVRWQGEVARLELDATRFDAVSPAGPLRLDCGAAARR
jgi:hypothetical protein